MRLIDADAAIESLTEYGNGRAVYIGVEEAVRRIEQLPSAQPERKTGRWIPDNTDYYRTKFICSVCGESEEVPTIGIGFGYGTMWDYCPNCGAKMERRQDGH